MSIMVEEGTFVEVENGTGTLITRRKATTNEVVAKLRQRINPDVLEVRDATNSEVRIAMQPYLSTQRGRITGPKRRELEREIKKKNP